MAVRDPDEPPARLEVDVESCPACQMKHFGLKAKRLPRRERRNGSYTHGVECPETGTPLRVRLERREPDEDDGRPWESGDGEGWKR